MQKPLNHVRQQNALKFIIMRGFCRLFAKFKSFVLKKFASKSATLSQNLLNYEHTDMINIFCVMNKWLKFAYKSPLIN